MGSLGRPAPNDLNPSWSNPSYDARIPEPLGIAIADTRVMQAARTIPLREYQRLFQAAPGHYLILDRDLIIVTANDAYLKATMRTLEEVQGRPLFEVFPDNPSEIAATGVSNLRASLRRVIENKMPDTMAIQKYDIRKPASEGGGFEERFWSPLNVPVLDERGEVEYIIHRVEDVTEFVQHKQEEEKTIRNLGQWEERTLRAEAEIVKRAQELQSANERLREERKLREQYVHMLTHDLRGPLTAAKAAMQLILRRPGNLDLLLSLGARVLGNIERMDRMITDLLDAAKIRAGGGLMLKMEEFDLVPCVREVVEECRTIYGERVLLDAPAELKGFWNGASLQRSLENLIHNAAKYGSPNGPITVTLEKLGDRVGLSVHNVGTPIAPEEQKRLFAPFHRARGAQTDGKTGWGLGLLLVSGIAKAHGGQVRVESSRERGTTFTLEMPVDSRLGQKRAAS